MQGGDDQVAGECRRQGDGGGVRVAHLADHDDFRILPQQAAQPASEIELGPRPCLGLAHTFEDLLDRILDGDDLLPAGAGLDQMAQAGINGRRLAAAARSREQQRARALAQHRLDATE